MTLPAGEQMICFWHTYSFFTVQSALRNSLQFHLWWMSGDFCFILAATIAVAAFAMQFQLTELKVSALHHCFKCLSVATARLPTAAGKVVSDWTLVSAQCKPAQGERGTWSGLSKGLVHVKYVSGPLSPWTSSEPHPPAFGLKNGYSSKPLSQGSSSEFLVDLAGPSYPVLERRGDAIWSTR